ncbi:MAG TPA: glycosyltransferase family 4 protein [Candidatus Acidoferrum sp.]|nr:glycosyltransferase family 4 protein [Candidatus Acidoferrum sp.]
MKVAIVNSFYPPWRGGAETYVSSLATALRNRGHSITVICSCDPLKPGIYNDNGIDINRLRLIGRLYGTPIPVGLRGALEEIDADILHANFPSPYFAYNVSRIARLRKIPAVLTWHNDLPGVTLSAKLLIEIHDKLVLPRYIHEYRQIIATSPIYASRSRILGQFPKRVTVIPNGVDCKRFNPEVDSSEVRRLLEADRKFVLLFVAALTKWHRYKGLEILLHAMKIAGGIEERIMLIIVGDGELKPEFESLADTLNLKKQVVFVGDISNEQLPSYYGACNVLVLPSKDMSEGFGLTLLEANATGKPCIASNIGGIPSVIENDYNGILVPPNDPISLAQAIISLAKDSEKCLKFGRNGRKFALLRDWREIASKTEQVYMQSLNAS